MIYISWRKSKIKIESKKSRKTQVFSYTEDRPSLAREATIDDLGREGLGQTENEEHPSRRETQENSSCSAESEIQSELRKCDVKHEWNTMEQQAIETGASVAAAAEAYVASDARDSRKTVEGWAGHHCNLFISTGVRYDHVRQYEWSRTDATIERHWSIRARGSRSSCTRKVL